MVWRDSSGRTLLDYPRPSLAVDVALLTVRYDGRRARLAVLVHERDDGSWSLPGTFVHEGERLREAALRALEGKARVRGREPQQLRVFDDPERDWRGWVVSVAHVDLVAVDEIEGSLAGGCALAPIGGDPGVVEVDDAPVRLAFDHDAIVAEAVRSARAEYAERPDPRRLLGEQFTLYELRRVHEAVLGRELQKDTFRRAMEGRVVETGEVRRGTVGKPARVFRRAGR
jgi:8-oxo-dGTP diphosphatase